MKRVFVFGGIAFLAVVWLVVAWSRSGRGLAEESGDDHSHRLSSGRTNRGRKPADAVRQAMSGMSKKANPAEMPPVDIFAHLLGKDRRFAEELQSALDGNDFHATLAATSKALTSTNAEIRLDAVDALSWFGVDALPELTEAMADPDDDVANAAETSWELALSEIDDPMRRFSIAAAAMATLSDKNHLETISGLMEGAALEVIDGEDNIEKASDLRVSIIQTLVDIMDSGRDSQAAQARDAYESVTGFEWRGLDEAELYLQNPDGYELPEDREMEDLAQTGEDRSGVASEEDLGVMSGEAVDREVGEENGGATEEAETESSGSVIEGNDDLPKNIETPGDEV